jgi:Zn-dependent M16 (insulinase) family peptidase
MLAEERKAHRENYRALSAIAAKIAATKSYDEYKKLKTTEDQVLSAMEAQKIKDGNDVAELRLHVSERDAAFLENTQHYQ